MDNSSSEDSSRFCSPCPLLNNKLQKLARGHRVSDLTQFLQSLPEGTGCQAPGQHIELEEERSPTMCGLQSSNEVHQLRSAADKPQIVINGHVHDFLIA
jgi:hypothetical protein